MFAHQKVTLPAGRHKIIILDEADRSVHVWSSWLRLPNSKHVRYPWKPQTECIMIIFVL